MWIAAIEGFDEGLGFDGHFMFGTIGEVNELLRVPHDKAGAAAGVTIVCGTGGIATAEGLGHIGISNGASPPAATHGEELAVPSGCRKPNFGVDVGIRGRFEGS